MSVSSTSGPAERNRPVKYSHPSGMVRRPIMRWQTTFAALLAVLLVACSSASAACQVRCVQAIESGSCPGMHSTSSVPMASPVAHAPGSAICVVNAAPQSLMHHLTDLRATEMCDSCDSLCAQSETALLWGHGTAHVPGSILFLANLHSRVAPPRAYALQQHSAYVAGSLDRLAQNTSLRL